jgi:H+/Cl- antiporter ClcA
MEPSFIKFIITALLAALSGFFLLGFIVYTIYAMIHWYNKQKNKEKIWGGLIGIGINGLVFLFTFPSTLPKILEALEKLLVRFR